MISNTLRNVPSRRLAAFASALVLAGFQLARGASALGDYDELIEPEIQTVVATSYYIVVDATPKKLVDNSGLSAPVKTGDRLPALWPTHDTNLVNMYWSGSEHTPIITLQLPALFDIRGLHYWNFNQAGAPADDHGHGSGGSAHTGGGGSTTLSGGPERGVRLVNIQVSPTPEGPFESLGSFEFTEATGALDYRGDTLEFGRTVRARYVRLAVQTDWGGDFPGLSEIRFIGNAIPSLHITRRPEGVRLEWTRSALGYVLEERSEIAAGSWTPVPAAPAANEDRFELDVTPEAPARFYRLTRP
jgi:hypothetical protein